MKEINYWQQFMSTGKIEDYLSYKMTDNNRNEENAGEYPNAGTFQCDRNCVESGTFRGI